jgi:hypothetical protein
VGNHKGDDFNERKATAANAKKATAERFRAKAGADDPTFAERQAALQAISDAREIRTAERKAARAAEAARLIAEEAARVADKAAQEAEQKARDAALEIERKAARDARYAARKARR